MYESRGEVRMIGYNEYRYSQKEKILYGSFGMFMGLVIAILFYNNIYSVIVFLILGAVFSLKYFRQILIKKQKEKLAIQFKDAMESMISALSAGYSLENSIYEAQKDLALIYKKDDLILQEFDYFLSQIHLHVPVEKLMLDFGERSGLEDIRIFSEILVTAKKTGGNLVKIMKRTSDNIAEKMETKREIETVIAGKKMEANCMNIIPLAIILYLRIFSPDFLDPLYGNLLGMGIMTGALGIYGFAFWWSQKIINISV